jgi:hypothetical protein
MHDCCYPRGNEEQWKTSRSYSEMNLLLKRLKCIWGMCLIKGFPLFEHLLNQVNEKKNVELITSEIRSSLQFVFRLLSSRYLIIFKESSHLFFQKVVRKIPTPCWQVWRHICSDDKRSYRQLYLKNGDCFRNIHVTV